LGQPTRWWWRRLDQPTLTPDGFTNPSLSKEPEESLTVLPAALAGDFTSPFIVVVQTREEFFHWLNHSARMLRVIQVEGLIGDPEVWALAAQGTGHIPLDVVLDDPAAEFSSLYRLVDVRIVRDVRVTIPAKPGLLKALRLAASLQLPVRLLPGQPTAEVLDELNLAMQFYLRDAMVEAPVEFFHSLFAVFRGTRDGTLWSFLEQDPAEISHHDARGLPVQSQNFVETHFGQLLADGAECCQCRWQPVCAGYFKWPDPGYSCTGVKQIFADLESAADEITRDLAGLEAGETTPFPS
jgi:hypothetical protein